MVAPRAQANTIEAYNERKLNVIVHGILLETDDIVDIRSKVDSFLSNVLQIAVVVTNVTKIDNFTCIVQLDSMESKAMLLQKLYKLEGKRIYIRPDLTTIEEEVLNKINQIAEEQRAQGNNVLMGYLRLYINGEKWVWNDEKNGLVRALRIELRTKR